MTNIRACVAIGATLVAACGAGRKTGDAAPPGAPAGGAQAGHEAPASQPAEAAPAPDGDAAPAAPSPPGAAAGRPGTFAPPPNRAAVMAQASNDIDASQRELDVAGGDCRNACRALGSMDRAAGRLCSLAQSSDEQRRCSEAKTRVYSARDKVRNTCGSCPDVSVDRSAPVPSR